MEHAAALAFSPDGRALSVGGNGADALFDVTQRAQPHLLGTISADGPQLVNAITFSPSGKLLATGNTDGSAHLWDVGNLSHPALVSTFSVGTSRAVDAVAISPDGKTLITVGEHGTDLAWTSPDRRPLAFSRAFAPRRTRRSHSPTAPTAARSRPRRTASP
jgi:WD40 repeat protein